MGFFENSFINRTVIEVTGDVRRYERPSFITIMCRVIENWCQKHHEDPEEVAIRIAATIKKGKRG